MTSIETRGTQSHRPRADAGMGEVAGAVGVVAAARTLAPSMMLGRGIQVRTALPAFAAGALAGVVGEAVARGLDASTGMDRTQSHLVVGAAGVAAAVVGRRIPGLAPAAIASVGATLAATGFAGAAVDVAHDRFDSDGDGRFLPRIPNAAIAAGAGLVGVAGAVKLGPKAYHAVTNLKNITGSGAAADAAGAAAGELIPRSKLTIAGKMFLENTTPGLPATPVRTYMPHKLDGMSLAARAKLAVDSMEAQGAFAKSRIVFASPTGTGGINPGPIAMDEILTGGDTAWVVAQYGKSPSAWSLHKTPKAAEAFMALIREAATRREVLHPGGGGPEFFASATSLGSLNLHRALLQHGDELSGPGIRLRGSLLLGAPEELSKFRPTSRPPGEVGRYRTAEEVAAVSDADAANLQVVEMAHKGDPVRTFSMRMPFDARAMPDRDGTLGPGAKPRPFTPMVSFLEHVADVTTAISRGTDETISNDGHDYRADMKEAVVLALRHRDKGAPAIDAASATSQRLALEQVQRIKDVLAGRGATPTPAK